MVNGYPTQESNIQRGRKQWNLIAPFFVLACGRVLSGLVSRALELCFLSSFRIGTSYLVVVHLLYVDDTLILKDIYVDSF